MLTDGDTVEMAGELVEGVCRRTVDAADAARPGVLAGAEVRLHGIPPHAGADWPWMLPRVFVPIWEA